MKNNISSIAVFCLLLFFQAHAFSQFTISGNASKRGFILAQPFPDKSVIFKECTLANNGELQCRNLGRGAYAIIDFFLLNDKIPNQFWKDATKQTFLFGASATLGAAFGFPLAVSFGVFTSPVAAAGLAGAVFGFAHCSELTCTADGAVLSLGLWTAGGDWLLMEHMH